MKKFDVILKLSFISYLALALFAAPYVTAQVWADAIASLAILSAAYQLAYIFFLRKRDGIGFGRSAANLFLYLSFAICAGIFLHVMIIFFTGYDDGWFVSRGRVYGLEAWRAAGLLLGIVYLPSVVLCAIYQTLYFVVSKKIEKKRRRTSSGA